MMRLLWPQPAAITPGRRPAPANGAHARDYLVIPPTTRPKLLLPARPRAVAAAAVRNYNTGGGARQQLVLRTLALALRCGLGGVAPNRISVSYDAGQAPDGIEEHLSAVLDRNIRVALHISPPRAVRKPVLQVLDERGETVAFAKLGIDEFTTALVRAEAKAVSSIAARRWSTLQVPAVLHDGSWRGHRVLVQEAFPRGTAAQGARPEVGRAADELARGFGVEAAPLRETEYWRRLGRRIDTAPPGRLRDRARRSADVLERVAGRVEVALGSSHGDWTSWNMTISAGRVLAWDWEKFESGVPVGFDSVHFRVQESVVIGGISPVLAFSGAHLDSQDVLAPHALSAQGAHLTTWLYALDIAVRYLEDDEGAAGRTRLSRLDDWFDPVCTAFEDSAAIRFPCTE